MYLLLSKVCNFGFLSLSKGYHKSRRVFFVVLLAFTLSACGPVTVATVAVVAVLINSDDGNSSSRSNNGTSSNNVVVFTITSNTIATPIDENSGAGQIVYTVTSNESAVIYSLLDDDTGSFTIDENTGEVTLLSNPIYNSQSSYSFEVLATNNSGNNASIIVTLEINDKTAPTITSTTTVNIDENIGAGQIIYTATSNDSAANYALSGIDSGLLSINSSTGEITLTANPSFETKSAYNFAVTATDLSNNSASITITLTVNDKTAPIITSATTVDIDENSGAGQAFYTVTSNDNTATYSLSGVDSSKFTINTSTGIVTLTDNPDFEDQSSYSFIVTATDTVGNSSSNTITLAINNIALAPFNLSSITASSTDIKEMTLIWGLAAEHADDSSGITYTLCEKDTSQGNNCNELTSVTNQLTTTTTVGSLVSAFSTDYFILASSGDEFVASSELNIGTDEIRKMIGYVKASNTEAFDSFSGSDDLLNNSIALSGDGHTLAVGAPKEDNDDTGIKTNDEESSESSTVIDSGAVYLYSNNINSNNTSGKWIKTAYIKASNAGFEDNFGISVALNYDGTVLAVGAYIEDNAHPGVINGVQDVEDGVAHNSGAVYLFTNVNDTWTQSAYIKPAIVGASDEFGFSVALSGDATVLAVGAYQEDSNATGVTTTAGSDIGGANASGAVYLFSNDGSAWTQDAYVKASNTGSGDHFGRSLSLNYDGKVLAVGAWFEDDLASNSGAVYMFTDDESSWTQTNYIKASNAEAGDQFGRSLSLNDDGTLLAVGAYLEDNSFTGIIDGSTAITNSGVATDSGAVYLYSYDGSDWNQTTYFKASNADDSDGFGYHIALSGDGNSLIVGSYLEDNDVTGIITGGDVTTDNNSSLDSGAVYLFTNDGSSWAQTAYIKASNAGTDDKFGISVAISSDGTTLAVGAADESNSATGIITDGSEITGDEGFAESAGAVYIY